MITLEKLETLRARTNAGFAEAKAALEAAGGDLEAAIALLEKQHKSQDTGGGFAWAREKPGEDPGAGPQSEPRSEPETESQSGPQSEQSGRSESWSEPETERRDDPAREPGGAGAAWADFPPFLYQIFGFLQQLLQIGNRNHFEIFRNGEFIFSIPISILVILMVPLFWAIVPSLFVGFFLGCSYRFCGPDFRQMP